MCMIWGKVADPVDGLETFVYPGAILLQYCVSLKQIFASQDPLHVNVVEISLASTSSHF